MTAFRDFLDVPHRTGKPRASGLTHVLDKGLSLANLESLVEGVRVHHPRHPGQGCRVR